ncbi:hypothetical protein AVEN_149801-1 [Araneus ventricosus]|uniref:Spidroin N-terminal domain-containing protein n=1 Tax=Araneus ventricosus TaxID=182803 RepID=A0A4Y2JUQ0_ARAVE|nr:hypothetical protein AVEN_149801-1 [Araneus ventricosus]
MNWIKQFVILFVFASGLLVQTSARTRSKLQPTERFEFCVARNLSGSSMFNEEDKERMEKIVMETSVRMREMRADLENAVNAKTMLRLFAAALACVVADCDSSVRPQREQACITALEACAQSLKEPAGAEVVKEMKKIFAAMSREMSILDEIADNSAPAEAKKKVRFEKEEGLEDEIREEKKELLEAMAEKKEEHSEKESEAKERPKRAYVNTFRYRGSRMPLQSNPTLESMIADKLLKSTTFNNFFNFGLSQEDAVFYSRSMVASGLSGYRYDIIEEAMNAVAAALSRLGSFAGPNDYAYTIGRAIASVLSAHELTFYADGLGIGSSLVYQLDSMLGSNPSSTFALSPSFGSESVSSFDSASDSSSGWGSSSAAASGGMASVQVNPSYVESSFAIPPNPQNDKNQFQNRLSYFLSQTPNISGKFCSGPFPGVYEVMNSAFADYGYPIASTIATVVSNSLNMLPTEAACTQYAEVISEVVADILNSNGYILTADPQAITNKISDLISPNIQSNPPQNPSNFGQQTFSSSEYQLNPSFSDVSYSDTEIPAFSADQTSGSDISSSVADTPLQQQNPVLTNSTEFSFDASPLVVQPSSKQDLPAELSSDGLTLPGGSSLSSNVTAATNSSWVIVDYPSDVFPALDKTNRTSGSIDIAPPIILEPGPVIPVNIPSDKGSAPESKVASTNKTTTAPKIMKVTKAAKITTPVPLSTNFQISTVVAKSEVSTPAPEAALKDAFESQSKLSDFIMKEMTSSLKALNVTTGDQKKQPDLPKTSGISTGVKAPKTADSPTTLGDSKPAEKSPDSQVKTSTEAQPQQQNGPSDEIPLIAPAPITDELSALVFADKVSSIVSSSISLIRSPNFQFDELCRKLNELAPMVDLPPLDVCSELPLIDYLLHILNAVTYSLAGEK